MKIVAFCATCVLAVALLAAPADPAAAEGGTRTVTVAWPESGLVDTHDVVPVAVTVDAPEPATVALERSDTPGGPWEVLDSPVVGPGAQTVELHVPTEVAGTFWTRVTVTADSVNPAYASEAYQWTVLDETLALSTVTLTAPGVSDVTRGRSVAVSGRVTGGVAGRRVHLQLRTPRGWVAVRTTHTDTTGRWKTSVPTDWYYRGTMRAAVSRSATHRAATSVEDFAMRVRPTYSPRGRSGLWNPVLASVHRWDPCGTIHYRVNTKGAPRGALTWVKQAFRQVRQGTGLRFAYAGTTNAIPYRTDGGKEWSPADFDVAWASPRQVRGLKGWTVGLGGFGAYGEEIVRGAVALDRTARLRRGFGDGDSWGSLLLHEIGHAVGLGHVDAVSQVMNPYLSPRTAYRWGAGDLNGLRRLGATQGCLSDHDSVLGRRGPLTWVVVP